MKLKPFSEQQIIERIRFENPWWQTGAADAEYRDMKQRSYFHLFYPLVEEKTIKRAVVLMGPRRVGKTVMIFHTIQHLIDSGVDPKKICYLSVETPIYTNIGLEQLFQYCRTAVQSDSMEGFYLFFDEIQYLKGWEVHLKSLVDSYRASKFIASGSAAAALKLKSAESGAGRFTEFLLPPLSFHEYIDMRDLSRLIVVNPGMTNSSAIYYHGAEDIQTLNRYFIDYINYGGYPEVIFSDAIRSNPSRYIRNDIIDKVLLRDLPSLYGIQDVQELNVLFNMIAYNSGNEFSIEALSQDAGVEKNTIRKYLTYLEAAFLIRRVYRIDMNAKRFKRANFFKIYLTNPSLRSALFSPIKDTDEEMGNMVETAIFSQWLHNTGINNTFYARWQGGKGEVDMVGLSVRQKPVWAVEVKWSNRYMEKPQELKSLLAFTKENKLSRATVTTRDRSEKVEYENLQLYFVPAALYAYTVGRNSLEEKTLADFL